MSDPATDVCLLYFDDCPNWRLAEARLKQAMTDVGADPVSLRYVEVTTLEQAQALGFRGSPTVLVDGLDPFAGPDDPVGLACRLYRSEAGPEAAPTVEQLRAVVAR